MSYYDDFVKSLSKYKDKVSRDPTTNEKVSGALAAEITLISTLLIASLLLRHINIVLTAVVVVVLAAVLITNLPLIHKVQSEMSDSLDKMIFYGVVTLGILVVILYWGVA